MQDRNMEHKFLNLFVDGVWTGKTDRSIRINGVKHDMDKYAKEHGIKLPDSKKEPKKKIQVNSYADMEQQDHSGDNEIDGSGDSQSTE
jgi:hypothetical protein